MGCPNSAGSIPAPAQIVFLTNAELTMTWTTDQPRITETCLLLTATFVGNGEYYKAYHIEIQSDTLVFVTDNGISDAYSNVAEFLAGLVDVNMYRVVECAEGVQNAN